MPKVAFSRDEVILLLDAVFTSDERYFTPNSEVVEEQSLLLNKLPIHPTEKRDANFRNCVGVGTQMDRFTKWFHGIRENCRVGEMFFEVDAEYRDKHEELHAVAEAIRRNLPYFEGEFGGNDELGGFPEGALLGHLHRLLESRDGKRLPLTERCVICELRPEALYPYCGALLENHLVIAPSDMDGGKKYAADGFITVCPNCHAALHRCRPWRNKENCGGLLR